MDSSETSKIDLSGALDGLTTDTKNKKGFMAFQLKNLHLREMIQKTRQSVKPWTEFLNYKQFKVPTGPGPASKRLIKNIENYQGNYVFVFVILVIFCILTSPLLIIAIGACLGACYVISIKNQEQKLKILGRELTLAQQYGGVALLSFPLFWIAGAGSVVFWVIGLSFVIIVAHASTRVIEDETLFEEVSVEMDPL